MQAISTSYAVKDRQKSDREGPGSSRRARIQQLIRDAHDAGKISDPVAATARALADFVLDEYPEPVCTAPVARVAMKRGKCQRTILRHIRELERVGLAADTTAGNGMRGVYSRGEVAFGVSFAPALSMQDELRDARDAKRDEISLIMKLRKMLSALRAHLAEFADWTVHEWLDKLPSRYDGLSITELKALEAECLCRLQRIAAERESAHAAPDRAEEGSVAGHATKMSDGPDTNVRRFTYTNEDKNESYRTHREKRRSARPEDAASNAASEGGDEFTLPIDKVMRAISPEWRELLEAYYNSSSNIHRAFALVAEQQFMARGGSARAWGAACKLVREPILLGCLVMIAELTPPKHMDRWLLAMCNKARSKRVNWSSPLVRLARLHGEAFISPSTA